MINKGHWIKTMETLPEHDNPVLVKRKSCSYWEVACWNPHYECWDDAEGDFYWADKDDVEIWMEVPDFY